MWPSAITAYFHYLSFMLAFGAVVVELLTLKKELSIAEAWRILIADVIYGISASLVLFTGALRVLYFGKGADYYLGNPIFYTKVGLFLLVGALSIYPTISFVSWIGSLREGKVPQLGQTQFQWLSWLIRIELVGWISLPLLAALLARSA